MYPWQKSYLSQGGLQKLIFNFFNKIFPICVVIINLGNYIWEFDLFKEALSFNDRLKIWWYYQKSHVKLDTILVYFERFYIAPHSCKVSYHGLTVSKCNHKIKTYLMLANTGKKIAYIIILLNVYDFFIKNTQVLVKYKTTSICLNFRLKFSNLDWIELKQVILQAYWRWP